jgi:hypothetical protein
MPSRWIILLLALAALASAGTLFGAVGIAITVVVLVAACRARNKRVLGTMLIDFPLILLIGLVFVGIPWLFVRAALTKNPEKYNAAFCANHLAQVATALLEYHRVNGRFPPAYIADADGRPMHSWRALILPYMRHKSLYKQYKFDEPWNGPNNRKLLAACPSAFVCPGDESNSDSPSDCTNFVAVVGPRTAWSGSKSKRDIDLAPLSQTILLVEIAEPGIPWLEPRDLPADPASASSPGQPIISSNHVPPASFFRIASPKVHVFLADGTIAFIPADLFAAPDCPLLNVGGFPKEYLDREWPTDNAPINWPATVSFYIWTASIALLLFLTVQTRKRLAIDRGETSPVAPSSFEPGSQWLTRDK